MLDTVIREDRLPTRDSLDHRLVLQLARTTAAEAKTNEQADKFGKMWLSHHIKDPELLRYLPDLRITLTNAVSESIRQSLPGAPVLYDLKYKLIRTQHAWQLAKCS